MLEALQQSSCFMDLDTEQLASIILCCEKVVLNDGDFMIQEGERNNRDFFILLSGTVEIVSNDSDTTSQEVVLSKADKDLYGELSWLTGRKRTASARCRGEVEAARVDGDALMDQLKRDTDIGFKVIHRIALTLAQRLEQSDSLIKQLLWNTNI